MGVGRVVWSSVLPVVGLVVALALPAGQPRAESAASQPATVFDGGAAVAAQPAPEPTAPRSIFSGPSLSETGRVGDARSAGSKTIEPEQGLGTRDEKSVGNLAAELDAPAAAVPVGVIDAGTLEREVERRFASLEGCRLDVARTKHLAPATVVGSTLTLRWIIQPTGAVASTVVVATSPVDLDLMACVKTAMNRWRFTRPTGGPVPVERAFSFRAPR